jgi:hypothetical protein
VAPMKTLHGAVVDHDDHEVRSRSAPPCMGGWRRERHSCNSVWRWDNS